MAVRRAQLVGSIPGKDASEAIRMAVERLGPDLDYLPDGETGDRRNWVISMIESFRQHPDLELAKSGDWSDYDRIPRFKVRRGHRLYGAALDLGIVAAARSSLPEIEAAGTGIANETGRRPGFQIGIPGALDLALFTFGPSGPLRYRTVFAEALAATMHQTFELVGPDVLFQIEIPVELVLLARTPRPGRPVLARLLAGQIAALARGAPEGSQFGVHLCLGDMNHRALGQMRDAAPLVALSNAIVHGWPQGRQLRYVHAPLAAADDPPVDDPTFYRPLADLRLPAGVRFIAGYAHEDQDVPAQLRIRDMIEQALGRAADVSTSCGLGRREDGAAAAAMDRIKLLLED